MKQIRVAFKTEMNPNNKQMTLLRKSAGVARFAYNWGLARRIEEYQQTGKSANAITQHRQLNAMKKTEFPWMYEVSKCCAQEALRDLDKAYKHFFRRVKTGEKPGFPRFKKKGIRDSFRINTGAMKVTASHVHIPRIGWIRLKERGYIPTAGYRIQSITCSLRAGRWFVAVGGLLAAESTIPKTEGVVGVDLGINRLATCSNGLTFENPRTLARKERHLKRLQRRLSRKQKGSRNRQKARQKVARMHNRIACVRVDAIHKMTRQLVKTKPAIVVIEDLNVKGMMKNHRLAKAIADASFYEIRRQLEYKTKAAGIRLHMINRWYPSSKTCSRCGTIREDLTLSQRVFVCKHCGLVLDRDLNAARNLEKEGMKIG